MGDLRVKEEELLSERGKEVKLEISPEEIRSLSSKLLKERHQFLGITAVDFPRENKIELIYHFASLEDSTVIWARLELNRESPEVPTISDIYPGADWHEREAYDLFGVIFTGREELKRILLPDDWIGHPLRKDYSGDEYDWQSQTKEFYYPFGTVKEKIKEEDGVFYLHVGPQHPVTHGLWRLQLKVRGDTILEGTPDIGYIHCGIEKLCEGLNYEQIVPLSERICYGSGMSWSMLYVLGVESLLGVEPPERAQYIRTIVLELQRITSHLLWLGAFCPDLGTYHSMLLYAIREREKFLDIFERITGGRLLYNYPRIGGVSRDIDDRTIEKIKETLKDLESHLEEYEDILDKNEFFLVRTKGVGVLRGEEAIRWGLTGPCLRAAGFKYDVRKNSPYLLYADLDFEIPVYKEGDVYSRYRVRIEEMRESSKIINQLIDEIPKGEYRKKVNLRNVEGEIAFRTEDPRGESMVYILAKGGEKPYRVKFRSPAYMNLSALRRMLPGHKVADMAAIVGSIDLCMGEVDR